jgi:hypothetical protein
MRSALLFALWLAMAGGPARGADPAPTWPSLAAQIREAGVRPESALARFIAANQDFQLLRPEERADTLRIPLWLRVNWRKGHPDAAAAATEPTGGYPFVLKEVWEWMLAHPDLEPGPPPADHPPGRTAATGTDHRISGLQTSPRNESDIRIDFRNPRRIIAASNDVQASGRQGIYYTGDGGANWGQTSLPLQSIDVFHSDPTIDWTSDGTAWSTTIGISFPGGFTTLMMRAYKSTDGGAHWTFDSTFSGTQTAADKQMVWVDHSDTSPYKDNIYAIWHERAPVYMNRRTGGAWQTPVQVSGAETTSTGIGADVKTNADGEVFGFWHDKGSGKIFFIKSGNGGASYSPPVAIGTAVSFLNIGVPSDNGRRALVYVSAGTYKTATRNLVYAAWTDLTGVAGCNAIANEPGGNAASTCKTRIWFSRSTDGGANWLPPVMVNDSGALNDQYNQALSVDPTSGIVGVVYHDTVADPARKKTDLYYQSSRDDGATWSAPQKVTTGATDETIAGANAGNQYGDYNGLSGYAGKFFPSWTDRRANLREEIWTSEIDDGPGLDYYTLPPCRLLDTRGAAGPLGGPALAAMAERTFNLAGVCGLPATARAVSVNLTVVSPGGPGDLRMYPADQATPLATVLNFSTGQTRTNNLTLSLAAAASTFTTQNDALGTVHLIVDVNGYFQ